MGAHARADPVMDRADLDVYAPGEYRLVCQPMISEFFII